MPRVLPALSGPPVPGTVGTMPDTQTKNVIVRIGGERAPSLDRAFQGVEQGSNKAAAAVSRSTGSIVADLRKTDKGFNQIKSGFSGLAASAGQVNEKLATVTAGLMAFHAVTQVVRGMAMTMGVLGHAAKAYVVQALAATAANVALAKSSQSVAVAQTAQAASSALAGRAAVGGAAAGGGAAVAGGAVASRMAVGGPIAAALATAVGAIAMAKSEAVEKVSGWNPANTVAGWFVGNGPLEKTKKHKDAHDAWIRARHDRFQQEAPFEQQARAFNEQEAVLRTHARVGVEALTVDFNARRDARNQGNRYLDRIGSMSALMQDGGAARLRDQREALGAMGESQGQRLGGAFQAVEESGSAASRARVEALQKEKEIAQVRKNAPGDVALLNKLYAEQAEIGKRVLDTTQKHAEALQDQRKAQQDVIKDWKNWAADQEKHFRQIADQEKEKRQGLLETYGLMDPGKRAATLNLAKQLAAGPGKGKGPEWKVGPDGRWNFRPGTSGNLSEEQVQFAQGNPFLQGLLKKYSADLGNKDLKGFEEIMRVAGLNTKREQAGDAAKFFANINMAMTNKLDIEVRADAESFSQQISRQLLPKFSEMIGRLKDEMENKMALDLKIRNGANEGPH